MKRTDGNFQSLGLFTWDSSGDLKRCVYKPRNALCLLHVLSKASDVYAGFDDADYFIGWGRWCASSTQTLFKLNHLATSGSHANKTVGRLTHYYSPRDAHWNKKTALQVVHWSRKWKEYVWNQFKLVESVACGLNSDELHIRLPFSVPKPRSDVHPNTDSRTHVNPRCNHMLALQTNSCFMSLPVIFPRSPSKAIFFLALIKSFQFPSRISRWQQIM